MSSIDDLKDGLAIDISTGSSTTNSSNNVDADDGTTGLVIGTIPDEETINRVDLSKVTRVKNKTHIKPKMNITNNRNANNDTARKTVDISEIAQPEPTDDKEQHISPVMDIVDPDNPNSIFSKYVAKKEEEAAEWIAQREEEAAVMMNEDQDAESGNSSLVLDDDSSNVVNTNVNLTLDDDLDISSIITDEEDKENESMEPNENDVIGGAPEVEEPAEIEEVEIDGMIDTEDAPSIDEDEFDEVEEEEATSEEVVEAAKKEIEEYGAEDIEIADDSSESFTAAEIVEDEDNTNTVGDVSDEEVLKHLQKLATEKLKPVSNKLDISSFTVLKKPITNINSIFEDSSARVVKWVLPSQESIVLMKEFSGSELEKLREYSENARSIDSLNRRFKMIYDHIVSPKPATFEAWLKSTPYEDIDHYFFAIYVACFKGANYLPEDCPNRDCGETFLTNDVNIMDMVKFDTKEAKKLFTELYQSEATPAGKGVYCTEIVPMNDKIAIAFRQPSIYNVFEISSLDDRTRNNYSAIIDYIPYIDTIYSINVETRELVPITYKMFPDNAQRTIRSKIQKYDNIFNTLSVDEFGPVKAYIRAITEKTSGIRYVYPAVECPKCHATVEEQRATAEELVFTRYQLGSLVTTSLS